MIKFENTIIEASQFPDGTMLMKLDYHNRNIDEPKIITWQYENDRELVQLIYLTKHLNSYGHKNIVLVMPYIPNARQDRVHSEQDIFTLKWFAEIINSLNFINIIVLDPHSDVSAALINNIVITKPTPLIQFVIDDITGYTCPPDNLRLFFPDNGAAKRYASDFNMPYAYGVKNRDWSTGKILGLDVVSQTDLKGKDILIIDDICSKGGTFYHSAKKLKEMGVNDIYLYISHCENTILQGDLINSGLVKKIYTTNSIFTEHNDLIKVINYKNGDFINE